MYFHRSKLNQGHACRPIQSTSVIVVRQRSKCSKCGIVNEP